MTIKTSEKMTNWLQANQNQPINDLLRSFAAEFNLSNPEAAKVALDWSLNLAEEHSLIDERVNYGKF